MAKTYNITFNITGNENLSPAIQSALKALNALPAAAKGAASTAARNLNALNRSLGSLGKIKADVDHFKSLKKESAQTAQALAKAQQQVNNLARAHNAGAQNAQKLANNLKALKNQQATFKAQQQAAKDAAKAAKSIGDKNAYAQAKADAQKFTQELKNVRAQIKQTNADLKENRAANRQFESAKGEAARLKALLQSQQQDLQRLRTSLGSQGFNTGALVSSERALQDAINRTTQALAREQAALERRNQVAQNFQNAQQNLSDAWSNFQNSVDTAKTIMAPFKDAANNAMNVEFEMSRVKALTQMRNLKEGDTAAVEREMAQLTAQVTKLGATTEFTRAEIAQAQGYFGMAGWDTDKILAALPTVVDLASITGDHNIPRTADVFSDLMTAMGLKPGQMMKVGNEMVEATAHFGDSMAYALTQSNMNRESFFEALKYSAPIAATAGLSIGEEIAANMIVANSGLKGSMAGTGMRSGLLTLAGANKKAQAALEEVGLTSSDAQKQMAEAEDAFNKLGVTGKNFSQRVMQLGQAFSTMSGDEKLNYAYRIFGKNAATFWTKLLSDPQSLMDFAKYAEEIDNGYATGWAQDTAKVMRDNTRTELEYLNSALDALQGAAGDALLPALRSGAQFLAPIITSLSEFVAQNPAVVQACAAIATSIAAATVAVAGFSLAMAGVRFAQAGWATAGIIFGDLATKITALKAALAGLTFSGVGASLSAGLAAASTAARAFGASMLTAARAALAFVFTPVGAVLTALAIAAIWAAQNWERVGPAISTIGSIVSGILVPAFENAKNAISNLLDIDLGGLGEMISNIANGVGAGLVGAFIILGGTAVTVISSIIAALADLVTMFANAIDNVKNFISALTSGDLSGAFSSFKNFFFQGAQDGWNVGANFVGNMSKGFSLTDDALTGFIRSGYAQPAAQDAQINTQPIQQAVDTSSQALGQMTLPAQETGASLSQVSMPAQELAAAMPMVPPELNNMTAAAQMTSPELTNVGTSAQVASPSVDTLGTSSAGAGGMIQSLGGVAISASVNIAALSGAASAVAGALQAKAAEIGSITIPQPQLQVVTLTQTVTASQSNATGGIYNKGAFLTSFAEDSAEAAIPLDGSPRAISLWQQAGSMLGVDSYSTSPNFNVQIHVNISGNANADDVQRGIEQSLPTLRRTFEEEFYNFQHERARRSYS